MATNTLAENLIRLQEAKEDIADAIVEMGGTASSTDGLEDMPDAIRTIQANPTLITKSITANGTYNASSDDADGYSSVAVAVPQSSVCSGTVTYTSNTSFKIEGFDADVAPPLQVWGCGGLFSIFGSILATTYLYGKPSGYSTYGYYLDIPAGTTLFEISGLDIPSGKTLNVIGNRYTNGGARYVENNVSISSGSILVKATERLFVWFSNSTAPHATSYFLYITGYFT